MLRRAAVALAALLFGALLVYALDELERADLALLRAPTLVLHSAQDRVLDVEKLERRYAEIGAGFKRRVEVGPVEDPAQHVLGGDIVSPSGTAFLRAQIDEFLDASGVWPGARPRPRPALSAP